MLRKEVPQMSHDAGRLKAVTGGGIGAGLTDFGEEFLGNGLVEVLTYATAGFDEVEHIFLQLKVKN